MDLAAVMTEVALALEPIPGLRVFDYPVANISPPAAVVSYPEQVVFDATYGRGSDRIEGLPVIVLVGRATDRSARDRVAGYVAGSGVSSVKARVQAHDYESCDDVFVASVEFDTVTIGAIDYLAAMFRLNIIGPGTA